MAVTGFEPPPFNMGGSAQNHYQTLIGMSHVRKHLTPIFFFSPVTASTTPIVKPEALFPQSLKYRGNYFKYSRKCSVTLKFESEEQPTSIPTQKVQLYLYVHQHPDTSTYILIS